MASQRRPGFRQGLSSLAYPDYRRFAVSLLLTHMGMQFVQTLTLWQVYELTGSALLLGLTGLARAAPHMVLSLVGGVIADRFDRKLLIQVGQLSNALLVGLLAVLTLAGAIEVWHLYVITILNSSFTAITNPARIALIPSLIPRSSLVNAIAMNASISQVAQIAGPALAGVLIATLDLGSGYAVNALLYAGAMFAILSIQATSTRPVSTESPWRSFTDGLAFVRRKPVILSLLAIDLGESILGSYRALLPVIADLLGVREIGYGLLSAAPGLGSVVGAAVMLSLGDVRYKGLYTVFGVLGYCVALAVLALAPWFVLALVGATLLGVCNSIQMIPRNTVILALPPDAMRGRVEAFRSMVTGGGPPLGYTLSGALAATFGVPLALTMGAAACALLVGGIGLKHRELRERDLGAISAEEEPAAPG